MRIAILGGGVAGVSSAIALKQRGFDVSVFERHDAASTIGAGIVVWPNAAYVLEQLGILKEMEAVSGRPARMRRRTSANEDLGALDIDSINNHMGYPSLSVLRRDFQNILVSKLESLGGHIRYGHTVTRIEAKGPSQAEAHFENGSMVTADVLIGADGRMASRARRFVHGVNAPVYQGFINWIGVCESEEEFFEDIETSDYWGVGERFGIVPVTKNKAYWAGGVASAEIGPRNRSDYRAELLSIFSSWPRPVQLMIRHTPPERINKIYVHDHDPIKTWHKHNVILVGDAAHAALSTSGQGACQALEDAWHLADILSESPRDCQEAFGKFTEVRSQKTAGITMAARHFAASLFNRDEAFCAARNESSKNTNFTEMAAAMSKGWGRYLPLSGRRRSRR